MKWPFHRSEDNPPLYIGTKNWAWAAEVSFLCRVNSLAMSYSSVCRERRSYCFCNVSTYLLVFKFEDLSFLLCSLFMNSWRNVVLLDIDKDTEFLFFIILNRYIPKIYIIGTRSMIAISWKKHMSKISWHCPLKKYRLHSWHCSWKIAFCKKKYFFYFCSCYFFYIKYVLVWIFFNWILAPEYWKFCPSILGTKYLIALLVSPLP